MVLTPRSVNFWSDVISSCVEHIVVSSMTASFFLFLSYFLHNAELHNVGFGPTAVLSLASTLSNFLADVSLFLICSEFRCETDGPHTFPPLPPVSIQSSLWQVGSCRQSCSRGLAQSRCNAFHLVLRAFRQAASVPPQLQPAVFGRGCSGLALFEWRTFSHSATYHSCTGLTIPDWGMCQQTAAGVCLSLSETSNKAKRHFPPSVPAHRWATRPLSPTTFWRWNGL